MAVAWTRAHERLLVAYTRLNTLHARRYGHGMRSLDSWIESNRRWKDKAWTIGMLTPAQARCARRQLNAWRGALECREVFG